MYRLILKKLMKNNLRIYYKHQVIFGVFKHLPQLILMSFSCLFLLACKSKDFYQKTPSYNPQTIQNDKYYSACILLNHSLENFDKNQIEEYYNCHKNLEHKSLISQGKSSNLNQLQQCLKQVKSDILKTELNKKIGCRRKVYEQFPNSLSFENYDEIEEKRLYLQRVKLDADFSNFNNFVSVGINDDIFGAAEEQKSKVTLTKKKPSKGIYSIFELNKLRYKYLSNCYKDVDSQIANLNSELSNQCNKQFE
jgi:hypothetical protein